MPPKTSTKKPAAKGAATSKKTGAATKTPAKKPAAAATAEKAPAAAKEPEQQAAAANAKPKQKEPIYVEFKKIKDQFVEDKNRAIRGSEFDRPAALLIDREDNIAVRFLRMGGPSFIDALDIINPEIDEEQRKEQIRLSVINAVRQGKPLVINLDRADNEVFVNTTSLFNSLEEGLMAKLLDRSIIKEEWYMKLVRDSDGDAYKSWYFTDENIEQFFLVVVTQYNTPKEELKEQFTLFKVKE